MKNVIVMFLVTIVLFIVFFNLDLYQRNYVIIFIIVDVFFMVVYSIAKIRALEMMTIKYNLEHKKREELEQELFKEIDFSNTIISRNETPPFSTFRQRFNR